MTYFDRFSSDVDHDGWLNEFSPDRAREDWCEEHQQRGSTCGACHAVMYLDTTPSELLAAVHAATAQMSVRVKGAA